MILAVTAGLAAAAGNVALAAVLARRLRGMAPGRAAKWEAAGLLARAVVIFGAAHAVWTARGRAAEAVVVIVVGAIAQLVGNVWISRN